MGIYFPLWRDAPGRSLGSLYLNTRALLAQLSRFGLVGDNVLGCRFLPEKRQARRIGRLQGGEECGGPGFNALLGGEPRNFWGA